jgi:uncharacterized membrane protein YhaH (DUF805 family)
MNRKALYFALAYSALVILFKLVILMGGYSLTKFGYYYSTVTAVFLIIPFYFLAIRTVRDRDYGGVITGREAMRVALTVFAVSAIIISVYNYFEYEYSGKELAIQYYNSEQYLEFLKTRTKTAPEDYRKIIDEQIKDSENAAFRATTGKLFSSLIIGLSGAFIASVLMKGRSARQ